MVAKTVEVVMPLPALDPRFEYAGEHRAVNEGERFLSTDGEVLIASVASGASYPIVRKRFDPAGLGLSLAPGWYARNGDGRWVRSDFELFYSEIGEVWWPGDGTIEPDLVESVVCGMPDLPPRLSKFYVPKPGEVSDEG